MSKTKTQPTTVLAEERTELAVYRTAQAASRSLMAWIRTGLSMIGFGFTIYKFLKPMTDEAPGGGRNAGLFLIGWGTLAVVFGCVEYWQTATEIHSRYHETVRWFPLIMAGVIGALGVMLFLAILLQLS